MRNNRKTKPGTAPLAQAAGKEPKAARRLQLSPLWVGALFSLGVWLLMLTFESTLLFRAQELSLFLPTRLFLEELMAVPGGLLSYVGSFLTQFFYYPWLGALLLALLWWALFELTRRTFAIPRKWLLWALLPSLILLATDVQLGYYLFHLKVKGYFFYNTLGMLAAVGSVWLFVSLRGGLWRILLCVAWPFVAYPLLGFYALLGTLGMAASVWRLMPPAQGRAPGKPLLTGAALLAGVAAPPVWYYAYTQMSQTAMYVMGTPNFDVNAKCLSLWIPFAMMPLVMILYPIVFKSRLAQSEAKHPLRYWAGQAVTLLLMAGCLQFFWYRDANYRTEMKMNAAMEKLQWQKVLDLMRGIDDTPTRLMVLNKNLALIKLGRLGNEMFHYRDGGKPIAAPFVVHQMQVGGKMLYYHYAKFNFCYRWCLEDGVEYGWKVDYLKFLTRCSLLSGEYQLARKFIGTLKQTLFYRDWALKYEAYADDPTLIARDKEFASILPLYCYENQLDGDNALVEIYLLNFFAHNYNPDTTPMYDEVTMMAALTLKDIPTFWNCFFRYAESHTGKPMPTHFQEAALLYGNLEKKVDISRMPFDKMVQTRFTDFMNYTKQHRGQGNEEQLAPLFYPRFGNTFYYFYFFVRNVKSN